MEWLGSSAGFLSGHMGRTPGIDMTKKVYVNVVENAP